METTVIPVAWAAITMMSEWEGFVLAGHRDRMVWAAMDCPLPATCRDSAFWDCWDRMHLGRFSADRTIFVTFPTQQPAAWRDLFVCGLLFFPAFSSVVLHLHLFAYRYNGHSRHDSTQLIGKC